jgi:hypothetical protein
MKIELSEFYKKKGYRKVYVIVNRENRKMACLYQNDGTRKTISYAKYLYTSYYNCDVADGDHVDHINGDKTDDRIENLQVISKGYNIRKDHVKKEMVVCICPICGTEFLFDKKDLSTHPNPCCSRSCGGKKSIITARENFDKNLQSRALQSRSLIRGEIKDKIIELRKQGLSAYKISDQIPNISRQTISRFLTANKL